MRFSPELIKDLVNVDVTRPAREAFGQVGVDLALTLIDKLKLIFQRLPPETITGTLIVAIPLPSTRRVVVPKSGKGVKHFQDVSEIAVADIKPKNTETVVIQIDEETIRTQRTAGDIPIDELRCHAVIYRYRGRKEWFEFPQGAKKIKEISSTLPSNFCEPTAASLEEALMKYEAMSRTSRCHILKQVWHLGGDGPRLVFENKPEHVMRRSLENHLASFLVPGTNVRPEQNTDETHPVDLRVEWFNSSMTALIEIKWLGISIAQGSKKSGYTGYSAARARSGATQLAEYLDNEETSAPDRVLRGYLIIFDARRRNVKNIDDRPSSEDAFHYQDEEIEFDPDYAADRDDFEKPIRFFLAPRKSALSQ